MTDKQCLDCGQSIQGLGKTARCRSCAAKAMWKRSGHRFKTSASISAAWKDPEKRVRLMTPKSPEALANIRAALQTPEYKAKRSLLSSGERNYFYGKPGTNRGKFGKDHPRFGCHHSPETKQQYSENRSGPKNSFWRGGTRLDPHGREFNESLKSKIRERDNHQCRLCGKFETRKKHHIHHINYIKTDNRPGNLISLCIPCHAMTTVQDRNKWPGILTHILVG